MIITILAILYVISVVLAYRVARRWYSKYDNVDPETSDIIFVLCPVFNVIYAIVFGSDLYEGKFVKKFFRLNGRDS